MRDLGDHVVEALDMLDIDRGVKRRCRGTIIPRRRGSASDAGARRVECGEFIDQRDLRMARDQRVEIHLLDRLILVLNPFARENFKALQQRPVSAASVGLDHANHNIGAGLQFGLRALQHLIGLADAGGATDENPEPASLIVLSPRGLQEAQSGEGLFSGSRRCWGHTAL